MAFHQASRRQATSHDSASRDDLIFSSFPPVKPKTVIGSATFWILSAFSGEQLMMIRDCVSPYRTASGLASKVLRSMLAPIEASPLLIQHSASATARPPSLQSCALFTQPLRIILRV